MDIKKLEKEEFLKLSKEINIHPLQSAAWGEVKSPDWNVERILIAEKFPLSIFIKKIPFIGLKFGYIPRGIIFNDDKNISRILDSLINFVKEKKLSHLLLDTAIDFDNYFKGEDICIKKSLKEYGFNVSGRQEQPIRTIVLDLSKSEDELLSDMRSKHRQYIRKSQRNGVCIETGTDENIDDFIQIIDAIKKERGYLMHESDYYRKVWKYFRQEDSAHMFIAKVQGKIVGTYMLIFSKDNTYEMFGGCNREGRNLLANYALKWESIKYSKSIGKKYYDQWGAEFVYEGLVQFKEGFGGKVVEYPDQYVYFNSNLGYMIYKLLRKVNNLRKHL